MLLNAAGSICFIVRSVSGKSSHAFGAFFLSKSRGAGEEDRMRPCSSLDEVESLGSVPALPPPLLPSSSSGGLTSCKGSRLLLLSVILMSGRPDSMIFNVWGLFWGGGVGLGVSARGVG